MVWRGRIPAAEMKLLLRGGTVERTWAGRRNSSGSICLVDARTGEGAWTGLGRTVCLQSPCLSFHCYFQLQCRVLHPFPCRCLQMFDEQVSVTTQFNFASCQAYGCTEHALLFLNVSMSARDMQQGSVSVVPHCNAGGAAI